MIVWKKDPLKTLQSLKQGVQGKFMRIALNKASSPLKQDMQDKVPVESGALQKSLKIRQRNYQNKSKWVTIVGPKSSFTKNVKVGKKVKGQKQKKQLRRPSKYYQLLNMGTKTIPAKRITDKVLASAGGRFSQVLCESLRHQITQLFSKK